MNPEVPYSKLMLTLDIPLQFWFVLLMWSEEILYADVSHFQNGLLQAPDVASIDIPLQVTLLPALPANWNTGSIKGARIRGGITLDFSWSGGRLTSATFVVDDNVAGRERDVVVNYAGKVVGQFRTNGGTIANMP